MLEDPSISEADFTMRRWTHPSPVAVGIGSDAHRELLCATLPETQRRVTSLPIWVIAVRTERRAPIRVATFASTIDDPPLRDAVTMNADEESRHKVVLRKLIEAYGIALGFWLEVAGVWLTLIRDRISSRTASMATGRRRT